jgi:hypothetical protein
MAGGRGKRKGLIIYLRLASNSESFLPQPPKCWDYRYIRKYLALKSILNMWSSNCIPWCLAKRIENMFIQSLHICVYNSFIYNCQNLEAVKIPFKDRDSEKAPVKSTSTWIWNQRKKSKTFSGMILFFSFFI